MRNLYYAWKYWKGDNKSDLNKNINKKYYLLHFDYILKRISNTLSNGSAIKKYPSF